jgi:hypothetical protein
VAAVWAKTSPVEPIMQVVSAEAAMNFDSVVMKISCWIEPAKNDIGTLSA